jgi:glycosyltransferase involved in cell wall biosynthesis
MNALVSVVTPTIPGREELLEECAASVDAQTGGISVEHIVVPDEGHWGCAKTMNLCVDLAVGEWLLPLADDDLLLPGAVRALVEEAFSGDAAVDVVYAPPLVSGNEDRWWFFQAPPCIPATALVRASLWRDLGGYNERLDHEEDRDLWTKMLDAGATFARIDYPCWVYRMHAANKSFNKKPAAAR